jgi:hypothetical protein
VSYRLLTLKNDGFGVVVRIDVGEGALGVGIGLGGVGSSILEGQRSGTNYNVLKETATEKHSGKKNWNWRGVTNMCQMGNPIKKIPKKLLEKEPKVIGAILCCLEDFLSFVEV